MNPGIKWTLDRIKKIKAGAHEVGVGVGTVETSGIPSPVIWPKKMRPGEKIPFSSRRTSDENALLIRIHKKGGRTVSGRRLPSRNPFFLSADEYARVNAMWVNIINDLTLGRMVAQMEERAKRIGEYIVGVWKAHIDNRVGESGRIVDVSPGTEKQKERQTGRSGLPPLYRTGMLYRSFDYIVKRYR